jgi:hypothetical protein
MSRGKRFESARRLSQIDLGKADFRNVGSHQIIAGSLLTPLSYELRALPISSTVFMSMMILVNLAWVRAHQALRIRQVSIKFGGRASRRRVLCRYEQESSVEKMVG